MSAQYMGNDETDYSRTFSEVFTPSFGGKQMGTSSGPFSKHFERLKKANNKDEFVI